MFEITDQLKKLEKQAERAQRYYELKNEYKNSSIELAVHNLARHKKPTRSWKAKSLMKRTITGAPRPWPECWKPI
ncbi:MAG: hypothetical protein R2778_18350 [Saprospiraceae bacterium]